MTIRLLCPFHKEKTPSFFIYTNEQSATVRYRCFCCGKNGEFDPGSLILMADHQVVRDVMQDLEPGEGVI
jgi:hypothetical protein